MSSKIKFSIGHWMKQREKWLLFLTSSQIMQVNITSSRKNSYKTSYKTLVLKTSRLVQPLKKRARHCSLRTWPKSKVDVTLSKRHLNSLQNRASQEIQIFPRNYYQVTTNRIIDFQLFKTRTLRFPSRWHLLNIYHCKGRRLFPPK